MYLDRVCWFVGAQLVPTCPPFRPRASAEAPYHQSVDLGGGTTHGAGFQAGALPRCHKGRGELATYTYT